MADTQDLPAVPAAPLPNSQFVGRNGHGQVSVLMPRTLMSRREALAQAAWLVFIADDNNEFPAYLDAVKSTTPPPECDADRYGDGPPSMLDGRCRCMVCARCGHHTGNSNQGHYWGWCQVTKTIRKHHFCCPDPAYGCALEAAGNPS